MTQRLMHYWWFALLTVLLAYLPRSTVYAEYLDTSGSLASGHVALAGAVQMTTLPGDFLGLQVHEAVGLAGGVDLTFRQIIGVSAPGSLLLGGALKWTILQQVKYPVGLAIWAGGHYRLSQQAGVDIQLLLDKTWKQFTPLLGLYARIPFPNVQLDLQALAGLKIAFHQHVAALVEGGIGISAAPSAFVAIGVQVRF